MQTRKVYKLKGFFLLYDEETGEELGIADNGVIISLYLDHIKATIKDSKGNIWVSDNENDLYGKGVCAAAWTEYVFDENNITFAYFNSDDYNYVYVVNVLSDDEAKMIGIMNDADKEAKEKAEKEANK